jgi:hypothetical protein
MFKKRSKFSYKTNEFGAAAARTIYPRTQARMRFAHVGGATARQCYDARQQVRLRDTVAISGSVRQGVEALVRDNAQVASRPPEPVLRDRHDRHIPHP